jgi:hypothetical protein
MRDEVLVTYNQSSLRDARSFQEHLGCDIVPHPPNGIGGRRDRTKQKLSALLLGMSTLSR